METRPGLEPITSGTRSKVVDIVKGIAIILVVLGHTGQGMTHRGWWTGYSARFTLNLIYSFHMPAFFFVAGLFVYGSIEKRGAKKFVVDKWKTILYPYLLFAVIYTAVQPVIGRFEVGARPFRWGEFLLRVADGEASWFLFVLFFCLMLALLSVRWPNWLRFVVAAAVGMTPAFGPPLTNQVLREFCFVAVGMWVGKRIFRLQRVPLVAAAGGFILLAGFQAAMIYRFQAANRWDYIPLGLTGTAGLFLLARLLENRPAGRALDWVGQASLAIFLLSAFAQGGTRTVLASVFHIREFWLQLLLPTLFAVLIPAILWYKQDDWRLGWMFRWPL